MTRPDTIALVASAREAVGTGLVSVYLFGSHATGAAHRDSDVDVGVLLDPQVLSTRLERFEARLMLSGRLGAVAGPRSAADVVVINDAPPHLARRIMIEGRRLFCADPQRDHAARVLALSRAADLEPFLRRMRAIKLAALAQ